MDALLRLLHNVDGGPGTALGATWNVHLLREAGALMGQEAIAKGASVLLGPTVNMQRSPLGGRGFESFSEDPVLAGNLAAASVTGIQSTGVAATIKHFVCNDLEDKRMSSNSIVSERALRELYLMPFQIVQRDAKPYAFMTAYNLLNGLHCSENPRLLQDILREEWKFDGLVMSDWFGVYSTTEAIKAGLDLEMPGPSYIRGDQITTAIRCGKLKVPDIDCRVRTVLRFIQKLLPLGIPSNAPEKTIESPEISALLRRLSSESIVLLKNENMVLPLQKNKSTAVIGPNAASAAYCGGGSASLLPSYTVTPLDAVKSKTSDVQYELGAPGWKQLPLLSQVAKMADDRRGLTMKVYLEPPSTENRKVVEERVIHNSYLLLFDYKNPKLNTNLWYADIDCSVRPDETAEYEFSCSVAGTAKIFVDGRLVVDNMTKQVEGDSFMGTGTREELGLIKLEEGKSYNVHVEFGTMPTMTFQKDGIISFGAGGIRLGFARKIQLDKEIERAVRLAKSVEQVVLCVGLNSDWESEGYDREHMDLPPGSDRLVEAVIAANPRTVVVNQSGTPVTMPWAGRCAAILQAWYGGNETGNGIADVLFGDTNPSGKLSLSFPLRNEDNPAFLNYVSDCDRVIYGEDIFMGYRFYEKTKKEVLFPFGHGLSYSSFRLDTMEVIDDGCEIVVSAIVHNTGLADGAEVVQVYIESLRPTITRPVKELKGFAKVHVLTGEAVKAEVKISKRYATSFYHEMQGCWTSERGKYHVLVGSSSANAMLAGAVEVEKTTLWKGL